jgi:hypothetical protein
MDSHSGSSVNTIKGIVNSITQDRQEFGNAVSGRPLPRRKDDRTPRTPSAATRREAFARKHPEILITVRREGTRLVFDVIEPGKQVEVYHDADAMMDDLEARHPVSRPAHGSTPNG